MGGSGACASSAPATDAGPGISDDQAEAARQQILAIIDADARFAGTTPLTHDDYQALAEKIAKVPGVSSATYAGDGLGSIAIGIEGGGVFDWVHITDDITHEPAVPDDFGFGLLNEPTNNAGFAAPEVVSGPRAGGTYATHFPDAGINPDPEYKADEAVRPSCPQEGRIAVVDFYYKEVKDSGRLYNKEFDIDGKEIWKRLELMGKAAGFEVDVYENDAVNASNLSRRRRSCSPRPMAALEGTATATRAARATPPSAGSRS